MNESLRKLPYTREQLKATALPICQGLLASGLFTEMECDDPQPISIDYGDKAHESGCVDANMYTCVEEAYILADQFLRQGDFFYEHEVECE